jgi:hypothetical protein
VASHAHHMTTYTCLQILVAYQKPPILFLPRPMLWIPRKRWPHQLPPCIDLVHGKLVFGRIYIYIHTVKILVILNPTGYMLTTSSSIYSSILISNSPEVLNLNRLFLKLQLVHMYRSSKYTNALQNKCQCPGRFLGIVG